MGVPIRFDRDGRCPDCKRGTKVGDFIVGWRKAVRKDGTESNVPMHDCNDPLGPNAREVPLSAFRTPSLAAAAVSGGDSTGVGSGSRETGMRPHYVQISGWFPPAKVAEVLAAMQKAWEAE